MENTGQIDRIRLNVFRCGNRKFDPAQPDTSKRLFEELGVALTTKETPPMGTEGTLLGTVEVPSNADVSSMFAIKIPRDPNLSSVTSYPGVNSGTYDGGVKYYVSAEQILDVASSPDLFPGLGVTLAKDLRK